MKKILVLSISVLFVLVSCGGGSTATKGQSSAAATAVSPALAKSISGVGAGAGASINVNEVIDQTDVAIPEFDVSGFCSTGTIKTSGKYSVHVDVPTDPSGTPTGNFTIDATTTFAACAGTDTRCDIAYVLDGSVASTANTVITGTTASFEATNKGTVNVTGFSTFTCDIDTKITITDFAALDNANVDDVLSLMTGTICGQTVAEIKALIDGTDAEYCAGVKEIAQTNA
ncbi:MAG: hypothetical protein WCQ53_00385 [bacterium]